MKKQIASILTVSCFVGLTACSNVQFSTSDATTATTGTTSTTTTTTTTTTDTTSSTCGTSSTVAFVPASLGAMQTYAGQYLAGPTGVTTTVNMYNNGSGQYYGNVQISYTDSGVYHNGVFSAPSGTNISLSGMYDNGTATAAYNYWYNSGSNFSGFVQDTYGALVVSVSSVNSNGCATGSIYFKNFSTSAASNTQSPYRKCWFIYSGPYTCRNDNIINKSSTVPGGDYTLLGTFSGLPVSASFQ